MPEKERPKRDLEASGDNRKSVKPLRLRTDCDYDGELRRLQIELVRLHEWIRHKELQVIILFEGRDAAGKGGAIKRITQALNPRIRRVVALGTPTERERTQWYFQRYVAHLPSAGEMVIFDRSWYNRAGVEYVMGFCTDEEHRRFLALCPVVEKYIVEAGIILVKYWMEVGQKEQLRRFEARIRDPLRQWKLSPMDLESFRRWYKYSRARDQMLEATDSKHAPWYIVRSDNKRRARLNCISHLLGTIPYGRVPRDKIKLPKRKTKDSYDDQASLRGRHFVAEKF